jgi:enoyl-CoA hydratase/carnithine racemase
MTTNPHIHAERQDGVFIVEIRRPEKKNALTAQMYRAMADALAAAESDASIRVILIRGHAGMFSSGNDLADFIANPPTGKDAPVFAFLAAILEARKPIVAAVSGPAVGIGTTMLLHCDYVVAGESTQFILPFVNLGLCPEAASSLLLPAFIGHRRATEMLFFGDRVDAAKALEWGLVNAVVADAEADGNALARAKTLASKPAQALLVTKALLRKHLAPLARATLVEEGEHFRELLESPAARECLSAFLEKRSPDPLKLA